MKGSQGLEALATLCGGARKVPDNESTQPNNGADQSAPAPAAQVQQVALPRQLDHYANSSFNNSRSKNDTNTPQAQQQQQINQMNPQIASLLNAGINQQNIANKLNSNDGTMALQQMVYLNLLQNQNSAVSKLLNPQQASSPQFVDQNTLAMVLALQQQQKAQQEIGKYHCRLGVVLKKQLLRAKAEKSLVMAGVLMMYDVYFYNCHQLSNSV